MQVKAWHEKVTIPTYPVGKPEQNPVFIEKRVYQGSSGKVYPHPIIESIADHKVDQEWNAVFIENEYLKIMVLPELGGRIQMAFDKTKQRHFIYYNQVIKPALVGLTGPWISGGIEFNWPQHHRPSTFEPVGVDIENNKDGSKTIWCNEVELMFRTKGMAGFTLYPDKAYLEIKVKLYNRTPRPQTFLWWANPAVKVNDHYQSVFPPDVHAVFDHGKRDVSDFPIATGTYYKVNYAPGTDISKYKNIPVPTSYMAVNSEYDFVGGYENDSKGGVLHIANHHVSPGKKQWTWGNSDFGQAWDRNLTDEDGPYIELMCGVYTDNQPDFSWIGPFEERSFEQYFMPYHELGVVKNATKEALLNLEFKEGVAIVKIYATAIYENTLLTLIANENTFLNKKLNLSPKTIIEEHVKIDSTISMGQYQVQLKDKMGRLLVEYKPSSSNQKEVPEPAKAAKFPKDIATIEQLYLTGLHLEQYRHATFDPRDYYQEALRRSPDDIRNNNAMGLWLLRNGQFEQAASYFEKAMDTLIDRNPNPYDGEPFYNLGQCLKYQGKWSEAYTRFYKATWNAAWQGPAYFQLAQIAIAKNNKEEAMILIEKSLLSNWHNHKARSLKTTILRRIGKIKAAKKWIKKSLKIDRFNLSLVFEQYLLGKEKALLKFHRLMEGNIHNYIEYALDYAAAGLYDEAIQLLYSGLKYCPSHPMAFYFLGWFSIENNQLDLAKKYFSKGEEANPACCFPYRLEAILALQKAIELSPTDSKAFYYLGNLWYDKKQYTEAINCWEESLTIKNDFPTVLRNLALAYFNKKNKIQEALTYLEEAFQLDTSDARILMELDQLYKRLNYAHEKRLAFLETHIETTLQRDDLYLERVSLYNQLNDHEKGLDLILSRKFHPWEGGEGKVAGQYIASHLGIALKAMMHHQFEKSINHLAAAKKYPHNLGEGKLFGAKENDLLYWEGCAYERMGKVSEAKESWQQATFGKIDLSASIYYNDQQPDKIFYQGLAFFKMKNETEAKNIFGALIDYGTDHLEDKIKIDYFAVSLPDLLIWEEDLDKLNQMHCHYLMGLGNLGLYKMGASKRKAEAENHLSKVLTLSNSHQGAQLALAMLNQKIM